MPNFDPILKDKLMGIPFAGVGTTLERNALQTLIKGLIAENKYSVEYIINLCTSYGYHRKMAKEVFTELTGLSPELIIENNEYYQNPTFVPSGTIAWGFAKGNDKVAYYIVPFEYGYALNKKNETEVPEQVAQFVDINSAATRMKGLVKRVFTIDQIITENLLLDEPIQTSAKNPHDTEQPYFSDPVRNLKNRYKKRYITDGEVKSEAFKLVASEEITEKEAVELAKWVDLEQEKRNLDDDEEDTVLDDKDVEFGSVKNDPKGRLQEEAQEGSRLKASADEETAKCGWCKEEYPIEDLVEERDFGYLCDSCVRELQSRGEEIWLKGSKKIISENDSIKVVQRQGKLEIYETGTDSIYGVAEGIGNILYVIGYDDENPEETADILVQVCRPGKVFEIAVEDSYILKFGNDFDAAADFLSAVENATTKQEIETLLAKFQNKKQASLKRKAEELKLEDLKEEEEKSSIEKAEDEINEMDVDELLNETTPQAFFEEEVKKDKIDNLNEKVSKIIDEFSARFEDFEKYDVSLQSYKIQMVADDKLDQNETIKDLELNAKAIIMIVLSINPKEDMTNVKKGLAIFSVNDDKTYWSGTFKTEENKFYAFTEEGLDALYRDLDAKDELVEDIVGNGKVDVDTDTLQ